MEKRTHGFGFPEEGDIIGECCGFGDNRVYARMTMGGKVFVETNGGPAEIDESDLSEIFAGDNDRAYAIASLIDAMRDNGRDEEADWWVGEMYANHRGDLVAFFGLDR